MINEREFVAAAERMTAEQFSELLRTSDPEQQRALAAYLGTQKFERMRLLAQRQLVRGAAKRGNVVILPGILGSELSASNEKIWFSFWSILKGDFDQLQVDSSGKSIKVITSGAALRRYYGEMEQFLLAEWNVLMFPFDWRLNISDSAELLVKKVVEFFGSADNVHLVAHSMGGLVSRVVAQQHPEIWARMGQLIMLGTPNYGSFAIPQLYMGLYRLMRIIAAIDMQHDLPQLLQFSKMFVGPYQMLPRPDKIPSSPAMERLFDPQTYGTLNPPLSRFLEAKRFQQELDTVHDPSRLVYIAGVRQPTANGIADWTKLSSWNGYTMTDLGDGTVPHSLGLLPGVKTYYVEEEHSKLPANEFVMKSVGKILSLQPVEGLTDQPPVGLRGEDDNRLRIQKDNEDQSAVNEARAVAARLASMRGTYGADVISPEERQIADLIVTGQIEYRGTFSAGATFSAGTTPPNPLGSDAAFQPSPIRLAPEETLPVLQVHVYCGRIEQVGEPPDSELDAVPVDAIAVGHYIGVQPMFAERAIDAAISTARQNVLDPLQTQHNEDEGVIAQLTQRGIIRGELGRPFLIPDPRNAKRIVVIAGMGVVGRFGSSELTVLARELFWSLGRLGKQHLGTVLIGAGKGNLDIETAVRAWLRGAALAIVARPEDPHLIRLTFVEHDGAKAEQIRRRALALVAEVKTWGLEMRITPQEEIPDLPTTPSSPSHPQTQHEPRSTVRLLIEKQQNYYRFSALSEDASSPERAVTVDPRIVEQINDSLAAASSTEIKKEWGELLFKLLIPQDVQDKLTGPSPVVLACDSNVAQLHWELMVSPSSAGAQIGLATSFLGVSMGVTRQLRNAFVGPPEPPPPASRRIRVLIIADTDSKRPLPGAALEGEQLKNLLESMNNDLQSRGAKTRIEIEPLIGPGNATCAQVLKRLFSYPPYDIVHYSGHCDYVKEKPSSSGWMFENGLKITANELSRLDRVPAFVFSNACESGVTPSRTDLRSPLLAPSFAEAFFERGVKNFVCTAWPVADDAATLFAKAFYSSLFGVTSGTKPAFMHEAMVRARQAIWQHPTGAQTWGAYQHYGNPWFRFSLS